jgi:hypothetical protein
MDNNSYPSSFPKRNGPTKTIAVAHQLHPAGFQRHNQVASAAASLANDNKVASQMLNRLFKGGLILNTGMGEYRRLPGFFTSR